MADETAETVCEAFERLTAGNPRFVKAPRMLPWQRTPAKRHLQQLSRGKQPEHSARV